MAYGNLAVDSITNSDGFTLGGSGATMKNRILNGNMVIDQRNNGASVTANGGYTLDRWEIEASQSSKLSIQQQTSVVPVGFTYAAALTSLSAYSVGASEVFTLRTIIEGYNVSDLEWGTANAKTATLSFWVRSSLTGNFGGAFVNGDNDRSYPFSYTINSANTWEQKIITVAGDTTGTWGKTNGRGIQIRFSLGTGSNRLGTAGAWVSGDYQSVSGSTSLVGTNGATLYLTGVQLEVGSTATSFDYRHYVTELSLCHRYFKIIAADNGSPIPANFGFDSTTNVAGDILFPVVMRAKPTLAQTATSYRVNSAGLNQTQTTTVSIAPDESSSYAARLACGGFSGATAGQAATLRIFESAANSYVAFTAEL
jgi:hypothetical protein